jgi:hypothetical protein
VLHPTYLPAHSRSLSRKRASTPSSHARAFSPDSETTGECTEVKRTRLRERRKRRVRGCRDLVGVRDQLLQRLHPLRDPLPTKLQNGTNTFQCKCEGSIVEHAQLIRFIDHPFWPEADLCALLMDFDSKRYGIAANNDVEGLQ